MNLEYLVNPSRTEMEQLAKGEDLRAILDASDDLYVWRIDEATHAEFVTQYKLDMKAGLYIDPCTSEVGVSLWSNWDSLPEVRQKLKVHPKFKYFTIQGLPDEKAQLAEAA